ncbi:hypothetical protein LJB86_03520, partial [Deltaproteobacteria bacterium OttesenSCG-928-M10]|nr:hypothetical protein [Deltaproteobacteria bacterium OttesenSCG-928-M10]
MPRPRSISPRCFTSLAGTTNPLAEAIQALGRSSGADPGLLFPPLMAIVADLLGFSDPGRLD